MCSFLREGQSVADLKTQITDVTAQDFVAQVAPERRRDEAFQLLDLFTETTGWVPRMWGPLIIGFGHYDYVYESGRAGRFLATGFSPRKAQLSIYIMPGYQDFGPILDRLGPHKMGKSCLYITQLKRVDRTVLAELITAGLDRLGDLYPITPDPV